MNDLIIYSKPGTIMGQCEKNSLIGQLLVIFFSLFQLFGGKYTIRLTSETTLSRNWKIADLQMLTIFLVVFRLS